MEAHGTILDKVPVAGLDLHFCPRAKFKVAASVRTGGRNCPPDSSIYDGFESVIL